MAERFTMTVELNGTDTNPYHVLNLTQNPFPQLAKEPYTAACLRLQSLGGDPIPDTAYIRERLRGMSQELIDLCCAQFKPGERVTFDIHFPL